MTRLRWAALRAVRVALVGAVASMLLVAPRLAAQQATVAGGVEGSGSAGDAAEGSGQPAPGDAPRAGQRGQEIGGVPRLLCYELVQLEACIYCAEG